MSGERRIESRVRSIMSNERSVADRIERAAEAAGGRKCIA